MKKFPCLLPLGVGALCLATATLVFAQSSSVPPSDGESVITSWVGNTGGLDPSTAFQGVATDLWVDRDGTAYVTAPEGVAAASLGMYRKGRCVGRYPTTQGGLVVAGNREHVFVGAVDGVRLLPKTPPAPGATTPVDLLAVERSMVSGMPRRPSPDGIAVRGLCATERTLYVSNAHRQRVEVWDLSTRRMTRAWPFARPGALVLDPHEGLWVVRERLLATTLNPLTRNWRGLSPADTLEPAAVVRIGLADGEPLESLAGPEVPTALAILPVASDGKPALLVADNGARQQLLVYSRGDPRRSRPAPAIGNRQGALGQGSAAATDRRFNGVVGLGVAADGALHVVQNWNVLCERRGDYPAQCAELLEFSPRLDRLESLCQNLVAGQAATVDPRPPFDVYVRNVRFSMAWEQPAGAEWRLSGRTTDPILFPQDDAFLASLRDPVIRTVQDHCYLFGMEGSDLLLYRRDPARLGDVWMHVGSFRAEADPSDPWPSDDELQRLLEAQLRQAGDTSLKHTVGAEKRRRLAQELESRIVRSKRFGGMWLDGEGLGTMDGVCQFEEVERFPVAYHDAVWSVDALGGIWLAARETSLYEERTAARFGAWQPVRQNIAGMLVYRKQLSRDIPEPFVDGTVLWHRHDPGSNRMVVGGRTPHAPGEGFRVVCTFPEWARYDGRDATPALAHQVLLPSTTDSAVGTGAPVPAADDVVALDLVGDHLFALQLSPPRIGVYDVLRGNRIATLAPGPEAGPPSPSAKHAGLRAFTREDGEVVVLLPDVATGRLLLLRWRPRDDAPLASPSATPMLEGRIHADRLRLQWSTTDTGAILGYHIYRSVEGETAPSRLTTEPLQTAFYDDLAVAAGHVYEYSISIVNAAGEGPRSVPLRLVPAATVVRFVGEDRTTLGDWPGRYGAFGYNLFGDAVDQGETANPRYPDWLGGLSLRSGFGARNRRPDVRLDPALPLRASPGKERERVAGILIGSAASPAVFPVEIRDGRSVRTSVYCGSSEHIHGVRVEVVEPDTGKILDVREFSNEEETSVRGRYLTWDITGSVLLRITEPLQSGLLSQCGINAIFFDEVTSLTRP